MHDVSDLDFAKLLTAQRIYGSRHEVIHYTDGRERTLAEWFEAHYGEGLDAFVERAKREGIRAKIERAA